MSGGLGEYFSQEGYPSAESSLPEQLSQMPAPPAPPPTRSAPVMPAPTSGMGEYFAQNGFGATNLGPPRGRSGSVSRFMRRHSPAIGALGAASDVLDDSKQGIITGVATATSLAAILLGIGIRFGSGWLVGKALAPNSSSQKNYSIGGGLASVFLGTLGLGITAVVADHAKR